MFEARADKHVFRYRESKNPQRCRLPGTRSPRHRRAQAALDAPPERKWSVMAICHGFSPRMPGRTTAAASRRSSVSRPTPIDAAALGAHASSCIAIRRARTVLDSLRRFGDEGRSTIRLRQHGRIRVRKGRAPLFDTSRYAPRMPYGNFRDESPPRSRRIARYCDDDVNGSTNRARTAVMRRIGHANLTEARCARQASYDNDYNAAATSIAFDHLGKEVS